VNEDDEKLNTSTLEEEDQRCILIIGGISIFLPSIPTEASACVAHEEVMQEASREEAMGPNVFKTNSACVAGTEEERQPTETVMKEEKEKTLKSSQERREEEEEHSDKMLTQWEKELKMLEDWLRNPETEEDCQKDAVMKSGEEFHPEEQLDEVGLLPAQGDDRREEELVEIKLVRGDG
jgi:hypothetical protein